MSPNLLTPEGIEDLTRLHDPSLDRGDRAVILQAILEQRPEQLPTLYEALFQHAQHGRAALEEAQEVIETLNSKIEELEDPMIGARFLELTPEGRAHVVHGNTERLVGFGDDLDPEKLAPGDTVFLNGELNLVVAAERKRPTGEVATFEGYSGGARDRVVIKVRGEERTARLAPALRREKFSHGDSLVWLREGSLAVEKLELDSSSRSFFLEEPPDVTFDDVGGLDLEVTRIRRRLDLKVRHPDLAARYGIAVGGSILLVGKPGNGKTLIAKAIANEIARLGRSGHARFLNVKPCAMHSSWYSESERAYRRLFRDVRREAKRDPDSPIVIFMDEIDAVGRTRGQNAGGAGDRVLLALAAELDGLDSNENILVVAATNRREDLDPALQRPGRLGDLVIEIPAPDRAAARAIFERHLGPDLPYSEADGEGGGARVSLIDRALARLYAPNADRELATLTLRSGVTRTVSGPDLISGAIVANVCRKATERACLREIQTGLVDGLRTEDLLVSLSEELESAAGVLRPDNCSVYISGLPSDDPVVKVGLTSSSLRDPTRHWDVA